jgi:hypothetical protein
MGHSGITGFREDLTLQRDFVVSRVPVYGPLIDLILSTLDGPIGDRLAAAWSHRTFSAWYERPLLLLGALRNDALREGVTHPLWLAIGTDEPDVRTVETAALEAALSPERSIVWQVLTHRFVQTNETSRAVAWLWPAALAAELHPQRSVALYDIGCSAGLNLVADRLPAMWQRDDGTPVPVAPLPPIELRTGFDLRPVDVREDEQARWLRACVWPGQRRRLERLGHAIREFRELVDRGAGPALCALAVGDVPAALPPSTAAGPRIIAYQTVMRDYVDQDEYAAYTRGMERWLAACHPGSALWMELEVSRTPNAVEPFDLTAHVRLTDGRVAALILASCEPHPRMLRVQAAAVEQLRHTLR